MPEAQDIHVFIAGAGLGVSLGTIALVLLFAVKPLTFPLLCLAAAIGGVYFVAMLFITPIFPGVDWVDPEFRNDFPKSLGLNIQQLVTYILCTLLVIAVGLALLWQSEGTGRILGDSGGMKC